MEPKLPQDEHLGKQELPHVRHSTTSVKNLGGLRRKNKTTKDN
jgi:hypothetical protein